MSKGSLPTFGTTHPSCGRALLGTLNLLLLGMGVSKRALPAGCMEEAAVARVLIPSITRCCLTGSAVAPVAGGGSNSGHWADFGDRNIQTYRSVCTYPSAGSKLQPHMGCHG